MKIELLEKDVELFILFQKDFDKIKMLLEANVFEHKNGRVEIHIDAGGHWKNIKLIKNNYPQKR